MIVQPYGAKKTIVEGFMGIRTEIFEVIMQRLETDYDYDEIDAILDPLLSEGRLKKRADGIKSAAIETRTRTVERALAVGMGLEGAIEPHTDDLVELLVPWRRCERLRTVAEQISAATDRMCDSAAERARRLGAQLGAGAAWLVFESECDGEGDEESD